MMVLLSGFSNLFDFKLYTWEDDPQWHDIHIFHLLAQPPNTKMTCQLQHLRRFTSWASLTVTALGQTALALWGTFPTFPRIYKWFLVWRCRCECACECLHYISLCVHTRESLLRFRISEAKSCGARTQKTSYLNASKRQLSRTIWIFGLMTSLSKSPDLKTWLFPWLFPSLQKCIAIACPEFLSISSLGFLALPFILTHFNSHLFPLFPHGFPVASPWLPHCLRTRWSTSIPSNSFPSEAVAACASVPRLTHQLLVAIVPWSWWRLVEAGG